MGKRRSPRVNRTANHRILKKWRNQLKWATAKVKTHEAEIAERKLRVFAGEPEDIEKAQVRNNKMLRRLVTRLKNSAHNTVHLSELIRDTPRC